MHSSAEFKKELSNLKKSALESRKPINNFYGDSLVVGCGSKLDFEERWDEITSASHHKLHSNPNYFYSIDIEESKKPDALFDIASSQFPEEYSQRFNFIFLENLPARVYLAKSEREESTEVELNNQNLEQFLDQTAGVILINGEIPNTNLGENVLYYQATAKSILIIRGLPELDPGLIMQSLNADAKKLLALNDFKIEEIFKGDKSKADHYNKEANEEFIKIKSITLLERQIERLKNAMTTQKSIFKRDKKTAAISNDMQILQLLREKIGRDYPQHTLLEMIDEIKTGSVKFVSPEAKAIKEMMTTLFNLELYHFTHLKQSPENDEGFVMV